MEHYNYLDKGLFSSEIFSQRINEAKIIILDKNNLVAEDFREIRNLANQDYRNNSESFSGVGRYLIFEIKKNNVVIGHLNCFMDNESRFIELFTS